MDGEHDKRNARRYPCQVRVQWSYFNQPGSHAARMVNFSQEGVALEAEQLLINGSSVVMRLDGDPGECRPDCSDAAGCPWPRSMLLGDVKWCRPRSVEDKHPPRWGAGIRIYFR
jgi:hypothetical protein